MGKPQKIGERKYTIEFLPQKLGQQEISISSGMSGHIAGKLMSQNK